jgi:acetolactate synthase-1/2/3 large subunit
MTARPIALCGPAFMTLRGRQRMAAVEEATGVPVVGMESPRGMNDPSLGRFAQVLKRADKVFLVGKRLDFTLRFGKALGDECEVAEAESLEALGDVRGARGWRDEVRAAIAFRPPEWDGIPMVRALRSLQPVLDSHPESVLVCDGGEFGQWVRACLGAPHQVVNGVAGSIGAGLPFAVAARVASPRAPVLAFMGDGTFGFHPAEIDTAVRYGLPFVAVVGNDARWNAEYQIQLRTYGPARLVGCELRPTRYDEVAKAFGGYGEHVEDGEMLLPAVQRAMASGLPAVVDYRIEGLPAPVYK